jgi:hypothetical protein
MSTVQVVGIAIAVVILVVLVISLVVTRRKDGGVEPKHEPEATEPAEDIGSFLDGAPRDELHMLGKRDVLPPTASPPQVAWQPADAAAVAEPAAGSEPAMQPEPSAAAGPETPPAVAEETTAEIPLEQPGAAPAEEAAETEHVEPPVSQTPEQEPAGSAPEPAPPSGTEELVAEQPDVTASAETMQAAVHEPAPAAKEAAAPPAPPRMVRLSDIIVTTNEQQVDLADPDVRRMLKDLVQDEIDLAAQYRELGQNVDAVLQLTEAGRICDALGMTSHAKLIRQMVKELQE